jgi:predicted nucleotidyltransferase
MSEPISDSVILDIATTILHYYPEVQGIYLFGSYDTEHEWPNSDVDLALLFPFPQAIELKMLSFSPCKFALSDRLGREVDLVNIRQVSTVFQNEIINSGRLISRGDPEAIGEFEMLVLSAYQKLNEERKEILEEFFKSKRAYRL